MDNKAYQQSNQRVYYVPTEDPGPGQHMNTADIKPFVIVRERDHRLTDTPPIIFKAYIVAVVVFFCNCSFAIAAFCFAYYGAMQARRGNREGAKELGWMSLVISGAGVIVALAVGVVIIALFLSNTVTL